MPDTLDDVVIPNNDWLDVATTTGIVVGTGLIIQNKGIVPVLMQIQTTKPDADDINGPVIYPIFLPKSTVTVDAGGNKVWLKASSTSKEGLVNIQEQ